MELSEGMEKIKGIAGVIPNASRDDLPELFKKLGFKRGVEIGVYKGEFTEVLAKSGLEIFGVDPWSLYDDYGNPKGVERMNQQYESSLERLKPYPNCKLIKKTSMEAVKDFENDSLDFVYIDGNHWFKYVTEDICEWSKRVKEGGIICGHDYIYTKSKSTCGGCHAHYVVDAYTAALGIKNWWVIGEKHGKPGEKRDKWRSWMWVNPKRTFNIIPN